GRGTRSEPLVGLRLEAGRARELLRGLACPQERAREDRVEPDAVRGEPFAELPGRFAALRRQGPQLVRFPVSSFGVTHDDQLHGPEHSLRLCASFGTSSPTCSPIRPWLETRSRSSL